jgi:hypothetical protein
MASEGLEPSVVRLDGAQLPTFVGEVVCRRGISAVVDASNTARRESHRRRRPTAQR